MCINLLWKEVQRDLDNRVGNYDGTDLDPRENLIADSVVQFWPEASEVGVLQFEEGVVAQRT